MTLESTPILAPMLVQMAMMFVMAVWLAYARVGSVVLGKVSQVDGIKGNWPRWIKNAGDAFNNQFEAPLWFFIVCILFIVTGHSDGLVVGLAWSFVITRIVHTAIFLTTNFIPLRFTAFVLGLCILCAMVVILFLRLL